MYQGKFDKKGKNSSMSVEEIVASRNRSSRETPSASRPDPTRTAASRTASQSVRASQPGARAPQTGARTAPQAQRSAQTDSRAPQQGSRPAAQSGARAAAGRPQSSAPARRPVPAQAVVAEPERRGPRLGSVIFYTLYFLFIFLFFVGTFLGLNWLHGWLTAYEAAQPTVKCEEVFQQVFGNPDWGALYTAAGIQDTQFEGKEQFVSYMTDLVGNSQLSYQETSAGLSGDKKYFVKLGDQKLAYFTLTPHGSTEKVTDIPDWQLGQIGLFYERNQGTLIQTVDGHVPSINGVPLTEDYIIQKTAMRADNAGFLPADATTPGTSIYRIDGLLTPPVVTVLDKDGNVMEAPYDSEKNMYVEKADAISIPDDQKQLALEAIKVYARYQIKEASTDTVAKYFDSSKDAYKSIMQTVLTWTKGNNGYEFTEDSVTSYSRYSDSMFSVYVSTKLNIKLLDGGTTDKPIKATLLFEKVNGNWKVTKMTNADIGQPVGQVRLTFMKNDTVLESKFYDMETDSLTTPLVSDEEGKTFSGWYQKATDDSGKETYSLVFAPDGNGSVTLPNGTVLSPMTLYALYE